MRIIRFHHTKAVELLSSFADLLQRLFQRVRFFAIRTQQWLNYALEKAAPRVSGIEDADRGDGDREGGVVFDLRKSSATVRNLWYYPVGGHTSSTSLSCDF